MDDLLDKSSGATDKTMSVERTQLTPDYPPTLPAMLGHFVEHYGDLAQIVDEMSALSFAQVEHDSAILARALLARGLGKGARVGLLLPNGPAWVVAWFAIVRIGAIAVQMSTFSAARELAHVARHADVQLLLTADKYLSHDYAERLPAALAGLSESSGDGPLMLAAAPFLREIWVFGIAPHWAHGDRRALEAEAARVPADLLREVEAEVYPADPAIMIYTSGSTSDPKAVVHSQGTVVRQSYAMGRYASYRPGDRLLSVSPLFWVGGLCTSMLAANQKGAALVTPPSQAPADLVRLIRTRGVTHLFMPAAKFKAIREAGFGEDELQRLQPSTASQQFAFGRATRAQAPDSLGMSETFGPHSMEYYSDSLPPDRAGSFGRGVGGVERKIVSPRTGATLPFGQEGELCVRGYSLMAQYYKRERSDCFDADGWFHTGDLCSMREDGYLFFNGRDNEMLKTSGANVAPREVEAALMGHPDVAEAIVVGLPHPKMGHMVTAAVVMRPATTLDEAAMRKWLQPSLSSFKIPKRIFALAPADVPRTATNKVRKPALIALLEGMVAE